MPAPRWSEMTDYLQAKGIKVGAGTLGQTTGGTHTRGSFHYQGVARDFGVYNCDCPAIAAALKPLATGPNHVIVELIWTPSPLSKSSGPGTYMKHGNAYTPTAKLANGHKDHVHAAIRPGAPHWSQWPGASQPRPQPQPAPTPRGFLMALSDKQQGDVYNWLYETKQRLTPNTEFDPNVGDVINSIIGEVAKRTNAHTDAKFAALEPDLKAIRAYLTAG